MAIKQAFILCSGFGTRLGSLTKDTPKPMLKIAGKPVLEHIINHLKKHGIDEVIFGTGYKSEVIKKYFKKKHWGIDIKISAESEPLGTAGALKLAEKMLADEFLVVYCDVFIDFNVSALIQKHKERKPLVTILSRPSTHPYDADLIQADENDIVTEFVTEREEGRLYKNMGNASIYVMSKKILDYIPNGVKCDIFRDIFPKLIEKGEKIIIHTMSANEFVKDVGTPERFGIVEKYLKNKKEIERAKKSMLPIKYAFIDRDGVINKEVHLLHRPEQMELLPGSASAIKKLNQAGIKIVVVTNQPIVARGLATIETLEKIHERMKELLEKEGAHVDKIYYCPHHPETHYPEGDKRFRKACPCRKPGNGMLLKAKDEMGIDLAASVIIGDSYREIEAGKNTGIRTIFVKSGEGLLKEGIEPDYVFKNLSEAVDAILDGRVK